MAYNKTLPTSLVLPANPLRPWPPWVPWERALPPVVQLPAVSNSPVQIIWMGRGRNQRRVGDSDSRCGSLGGPKLLRAMRVMVMGSLLVGWWAWWWCSHAWKVSRGSNSTEINPSSGSVSTSYVGRRWGLHAKMLACRGRWWTWCSWQWWTETGGATATCQLAPVTLKKYFNVWFVSPRLGGPDWKDGWADPFSILD